MGRKINVVILVVAVQIMILVWDSSIIYELSNVVKSSTPKCTPLETTLIPTIPYSVHSSVPAMAQPCVGRDYTRPWFNVTEGEHMTCNYTNANEFFQQHTNYPYDKQAESDLIDLFLATKEVLNHVTVKFFLAHSTLLGWYRECAFPAETSTLELGIQYSDMKKYKDSIISELESHGIALISENGDFQKGIVLQFEREGKFLQISTFNLDIFRGQSREKEFIWTSIWRDHRIMRKMVFPRSDFMKTEFYNQSVLVPERTLEWLVAIYGKSWNTPKQFSWWTDPRNFVDEQILSNFSSIDKEFSDFGPNMVRNPSFEEPGKKYWTLEGAVRLSPEKHDGQWSAWCENSPCTISQDVELRDVKEQVLFGGWSKLASIPNEWGSPEDFSINLIFYDSEKRETVVKTFSADFGIRKGDWQYTSNVIDPSEFSGLVYARISISFRRYAGALFDEIAIRRKVGCPEDCSKRGLCVYGICHCFAEYKGTTCSSKI